MSDKLRAKDMVGKVIVSEDTGRKFINDFFAIF